MTSSYSDLQIFQECPRKLGFTKLGYKPVAQNEAMTTGQFVHSGLRAFFAGGAMDTEYATQVVNEAKNEAILMLDKVDDREQRGKLLKQTNDAAGRAHQLLHRYLNSYASDYSNPLPEVVLNHSKVVCHVDLVAEFKGELSIVDFKTSKSPDMRWYDFSGQCDLYAYVLWNCPEWNFDVPGWLIKKSKANPVGLIIYDIISEEGLFRHIRRPNLDRGKKLFGQIDTLDNLEVNFLLSKPQYQWKCPRCDYFLPCWLTETDSLKAGIEYLMSNFVKEPEGET